MATKKKTVKKAAKATKKPKFLTSIVALRKKFPKSSLGFREKDILESPGAKISGGRDGIYTITHGDKSSSMDFLYNSKHGHDWKVVG